jgi:hypothetical protein
MANETKEVEGMNVTMALHYFMPFRYIIMGSIHKINIFYLVYDLDCLGFELRARRNYIFPKTFGLSLWSTSLPSIGIDVHSREERRLELEVNSLPSSSA